MVLVFLGLFFSCLSLSMLFHLAQCSPGPPMLSKRVKFSSSLCPSSIPLCKCIAAFFIHLSAEGYLGSFRILAIVNNAAMNIGVHVFFQISVLDFFG